MARRPMKPDDLRLAKGVADPRISSNGERVAWTETSFDLEKDSPISTIMVAAADGSGEPRQFTNGPHDFSPWWPRPTDGIWSTCQLTTGLRRSCSRRSTAAVPRG